MKKLYRSKKEKILGGFCSGLAEYFNIDPILIRIIFVIAAFLNGIGIIIYLVGLIIVPSNPDENILDEKKSLIRGSRDLYFWGILAITIGIILLIKESGWFYYFHWHHYSWSFMLGFSLILVGAYLVYAFIRSSKNENIENTDNKASIGSYRWYRKCDDKIFFGICSGMADSLNIDVSLIRIAWILLTVMTEGILLLLYIILIFVLPEKPCD